ncbi:HsdR family type I site-specific deoxyribonuclease [Cytophagaceae bacterium ABcell3]|nr:HsdR family type I site-specific deoxyribonuclease [Cytophagaceae bacterium ABcell3]
MSEYLHIEQPFLQQLKNLGWHTIDQGKGIPCDPGKSCRYSFREVLLKDIFTQAVRKINQTESGAEWLTDKQLEDIHDELMGHKLKSLLEANKEVFELITKNTRTDKNELTGEEYPVVKIIDFDNPSTNHFLAINQFRIDTPGTGKGFIILDIVLFVNGLPLVVVECKEQNAFTSNPLHEAIEQILRYSNQREGTHADGLKEGDERLFWFNQFSVATHGEVAQYGTITSSENYYFEWKDIYPETYKAYLPPLGKARSQEVLVQGMLPPETLLDIVRHFTLYMRTNDREIKIISRYQQYRAVGKIVERLLTGKTPLERSGVVWHTQGSGKSLTMVMLVRKLRTTEALKDYKILMVNDRTDLEGQLGATAELTEEKVDYVHSTTELKHKLATPSSNLVMVMIHKFQEKVQTDDTEVGQALAQAAEPLVTYNRFGKVNPSEKILILIDEAHRTQSSDLGDNLFEAFPNSTKIAFTGTPLITDRHKKKTHDRFGTYIDKYKLKDAVDDGATLQILYEGKTSDDAVRDKHEMEVKFEDLVKDHTKEEREAITKRYGTYGDVLEAEERIAAIARDLVNHYIDNILLDGFKAQVVASSVLAAVRYKKAIEKALAERIETERKRKNPDEELIRKIEFLKVEVVVSSQGTNEAAIITEARKSAQRNNAVDNFKDKFDYEKPLTGIAFLVVCDMLLTGFDAPIEQIMYLDKKMKEHNLLQAIARVNRTASGKSRGFVVDYIGNTNNLKEALSIYSSDDLEDILDSFKRTDTEIPILEQRFNRLIQLFKEKGVKRIKDYVEQATEDTAERQDILEACIELAADVKFRADFDVFFKSFMESMNIVLPNAAANPFKIPAKQFGYILLKIRNRYKDNSISIEGAGEKIKRLINEHVVNLGINPKIPPVELFSESFEEEVSKNISPKAIASEMEHAIRKHIKVNFEEDPALFTKLHEKLEAIIQQYKDDWERLVKEFKGLTSEALAGRQQTEEGVTATEAPFYDLMIQIAWGKEGTPSAEEKEKCKEAISQIIEELAGTIGIIDFWNKGKEIERTSGEIEDILIFSGIGRLAEKDKEITTEIMALAKKRHQEIVKGA